MIDVSAIDAAGADGIELWAAIIGAGAAIIGGIVTIVGQGILDYIRAAPKRKLDGARKAYLKEMLDNPGPTGWRKMQTMSRVIGASEDETARLLIELKARGNEKDNNVWAYIKDKPIPKPEGSS